MGIIVWNGYMSCVWLFCSVAKGFRHFDRLSLVRRVCCCFSVGIDVVESFFEHVIFVAWRFEALGPTAAMDRTLAESHVDALRALFGANPTALEV